MIYVPKILKFSVKLGTAVIFITGAKMVVRRRRKLDSIVSYALLSFNGGYSPEEIICWQLN